MKMTFGEPVTSAPVASAFSKPLSSRGIAQESWIWGPGIGKHCQSMGSSMPAFSGYGTDQQFLLMKRLWNEINPKYVVLTFCVDNDRDDNTSHT
jgi:hypothetical protein